MILYNAGFEMGIDHYALQVDRTRHIWLQYDFRAGFIAAQYLKSLPEGWLE